MANSSEKSCGFAIAVYDERIIEENARERADDGETFGGLLTSDGTITDRGWAQLNDDSAKLERNALAWLRKNFVGAADQGHDSSGDLIGNLRYSARSKKQKELIELGVDERIDMIDGSFGDLSDTAFNGVSDFGQAVLGGQINFFDVE